MDLVILVAELALVGFLVWFITTKVPMPPLWANIIQVIALFVLIVYFLSRVIILPNVLR
jgi:hypothetical protein